MPIKALLTILAFVGSLLFFALHDAEAARLGGGRSFGSRPTMQRPAPAPAQKRPPMGNAAQAQATKPGMGGMGGMLGGLLAGTLIGSLLFGGGFQGGGFMDILLIALLAYLGFKLFARFRASRAPAEASAGAGGMHYQAQSAPHAPTGGNAWDNLRSQQAQEAPATPGVPAGFDTEDFLRGAKMAFTRLQKSWDERNLGDIAQFATPAVMQEITRQSQEGTPPGRTEILLLNAQLLDVREEGGKQTASVFFDVLMRETPAQDTAQVREVWHFVRPLDGSDSWKLDGIQQVE